MFEFLVPSRARSIRAALTFTAMGFSLALALVPASVSAQQNGTLRGRSLMTAIIAAIHPGGPNQFEIERGAFEMMIDRGDEVFATLQFASVANAARGVGVRMFGIRPADVAFAFGLRNGDVLQTINGQDVTSPDRARALYADQRAAQEVILGLVRRGAPMRIVLRIRP